MKMKATDYLQKIGHGIKAAREYHQLSQTQLADKIGVKQPRIAEWEKGENEMTISYALYISRALGIQESDLTADEFLFIKNGVRVLVKQNLIIMRTPAQVRGKEESRYDETTINSPENQKRLIKYAEEVAESFA